MSERLSLFIKQSVAEELRVFKNNILLKSRKEVDINKDGSGYTIKEGVNKDKVLAHIKVNKKEI